MAIAIIVLLSIILVYELARLIYSLVKKDKQPNIKHTTNIISKDENGQIYRLCSSPKGMSWERSTQLPTDTFVKWE